MCNLFYFNLLLSPLIAIYFPPEKGVDINKPASVLERQLCQAVEFFNDSIAEVQRGKWRGKWHPVRIVNPRTGKYLCGADYLPARMASNRVPYAKVFVAPPISLANQVWDWEKGITDWHSIAAGGYESKYISGWVLPFHYKRAFLLNYSWPLNDYSSYEMGLDSKAEYDRVGGWFGAMLIRNLARVYFDWEPRTTGEMICSDGVHKRHLLSPEFVPFNDIGDDDFCHSIRKDFIRESVKRMEYGLNGGCTEIDFYL